MTTHIPGSLIGTGRAPMVNLIISLGDHDRYLVQVSPTDPLCPRIALPAQPHGSDRLGSRIEAVARSTLGLLVTYVGLLHFEDSSDMYALVISRESVAQPSGFVSMTLSELVKSGVVPSLVRLFQLAAQRIAAEQFAVTIGGSVQRAFARTARYLQDRFSIEDGRAGWSQHLSGDMVGMLSSAQGLLALTHANVRSRHIEATAKCLAAAQNDDGGWQVKHSLIGGTSEASVTESTCYCLWALIEAGRPANDHVITSGTVWLLETQRPSGGWGVSAKGAEAQVFATAFATRILASLGFAREVAKGIDWLRSTQCVDGGWAFSRVRESEGRLLSTSAATAHAVIALLSAGIPPTDPAVDRGCAYLRRRFNPMEVEPWPCTASDTLVDPAPKSRRIIFRHYTTPWALVALSLAGADLSDPLLQHGISRLLDLQTDEGAWRCALTSPGMQTIWAAHDAVFALKTVVSIGVGNLAPMALRVHADQTIAMLESVIFKLLSGGEAGTSLSA